MPLDKDLLKQLGRLMAEQDNDDDDDVKPQKPSEDDQREILADFAKQPVDHLKVGDLVVRNKYGKARYKLPAKGDACIITDVFPSPIMDKEENTCHGSIGVIVEGKGYSKESPAIISHAVDFRYYTLWKGTSH